MVMELEFDEAFGGGRPHGAWARWVRLHRKRLWWLIQVKGEVVQKRALDVLGTMLLTPVILPVVLFAALLIKLTDGGPVLHWQKRVGWRGRQFDFPKLRSMVVDAEARRHRLEDRNAHASGITFKLRDDPRITWIGRIIRRWSIDELSQFWCVLAGDMSLVGPRPALPSEVSRYSQSNRRRLDATPGLTCLWQVNGRAELPFEKQVVLDVDYIHERSLGLDLRILLRTVPAVINGRGAY